MGMENEYVLDVVKFFHFKNSVTLMWIHRVFADSFSQTLSQIPTSCGISQAFLQMHHK